VDANAKNATTLPTEEETELILATTTVEDFDRFLNVRTTGCGCSLAGHKSRPQPAQFGGQYDS
jgi:hypothetical protein